MLRYNAYVYLKRELSGTNGFDIAITLSIITIINNIIVIKVVSLVLALLLLLTVLIFERPFDSSKTHTHRILQPTRYLIARTFI